MAYQKLVGQPQRCLIPVPSDTVHIPCPAYFKYNNTNTASGVATTLQLHPSQPSFNVKGVKVGDIIYAETTPGASFVTEIVNSHQLTVEATGIDFSGAGQEFNIWGPERVPCVLMATGAGATNALRVVTQDGVILASGATVGDSIEVFTDGSSWYSTSFVADAAHSDDIDG